MCGALLNVIVACWGLVHLSFAADMDNQLFAWHSEGGSWFQRDMVLLCGKLLCFGLGKDLALKGTSDCRGWLVVVYVTVAYDWCETFHAISWWDML